jgi:hypothetical protein
MLVIQTYKGYFLHIKNEDDLNGATVSFYDGLGVKNLGNQSL